MGNTSTILGFIKRFDTEEKCIAHLTKMRWSNTVACPHCGSLSFYSFKDKKTYKCKDCSLKFNVKTKSIFEGSNIPLMKWMMAIYLCNSLKRGIASAQLAREIGVTQKTAWFILQRLRKIFENQETSFFDGGEVEMDETYIGGDAKNKHFKERRELAKKRGTGANGKLPVFGMLQRNGNVCSMAFKDHDKLIGEDVKPIIRKRINTDAVLISDGSGIYSKLYQEYMDHQIISHNRGEYVRGQYHTNTIEGYWSILKRTISGTYNNVSRKHMNRYCKEVDFRYNTRNNTTEERINLTLQNCDGRLKYKELN